MVSFDSTDLDNATNESGVAHETVQDTSHTNDSRLQQGYAYTNLPGTPTSWYPFEEGSGTTGVDVVGTNTGTHTNVSLSNNGVLGGTSATYDGSSSYTQLSTFALDDDWGISAWIRPGSFTNTTNPRVLDSAPNDSNGIRVFLTDSGALRFDNVTTGDSLTTNTTLSLGTWAHVMPVIESGTMKVYINGSVDGNTVASASVNEDSALYVGAKADESIDFYQGRVCQVGVYPSSPTQTLVDELYNTVATSGSLTTQFKSV